MVELAFETLGCPAVYLGMQAVLGLYACEGTESRMHAHVDEDIKHNSR